MGNYPFIQVPLISGGMIIAHIALVHVLLAHYSVGTGILLFGLEKADPDGKNEGIQSALDLLGVSIIYINFVIGAITGVGIWFSISIFSADATQFLIQKFVWLWGVEWTFFAVEIIIGYLYYYNRRLLPYKARKKLAFLYMVFTWLSLVVITGILGFMMTANEGSAISSWASASTWPSIGLRTISSISLACLVLMVLVNIKIFFNFNNESHEKRSVFQVIDGHLRWVFLMLPFGLWYRATLPATSITYAEGSSIPISMFLMLTGFFSVIITVTAWYAYLHKRILQIEIAGVLLLLAIVTTCSTEFVREGIRKPYIIQPVIYSNGIRKKDLNEWQKQVKLNKSVLLVNSLYPYTPKHKEAGQWLLPDKLNYYNMTRVERGKYIFQSQCSNCHTINGFNALKHAVRGWEDKNFAEGVLRNLHISKPFMPPFIGSESDQADLINFAQTLN